MSNVIFYSATAPDRHDEVITWAKSVRSIYPDASIVFDAVLYNDREQLSQLEQICSEVRVFKNADVDKRLAKTAKLPSKNIPADRNKFAVFCAGWRCFYIQCILEKYKKPVIWMDTDSLLRKNIDKTLSLVSNYDILLMERPESVKKQCRALSSFYIVNYNEGGISFARQMAEKYLEHFPQYGFYTDQFILHLCSLNHKKLNLGLSYGDSGFAKESFVWHRKLKRKDSPIWQAACNEYL